MPFNRFLWLLGSLVFAQISLWITKFLDHGGSFELWNLIIDLPLISLGCFLGYKLSGHMDKYL